ncbi:MAG: hypothetical protein JW798_14080 [Prolixibacteraceae bacterium]|nr:hypothetical protein [Prolixibacteraceae bacterium]
MMKSINIFLTVFLLGFAKFSMAQPDSTLVKEVEVIKAYQPSITESYKISFSPKISDTVNYTPNFDYNIAPGLIPSEKSIQHLPVVKLGTPPRYKQNTGYVKAGFGYEITPYAEVIVNTPPSRNAEFGAHLFHFSSFPEIELNNELKVDGTYSKNLARIFMKHYLKKANLDWDIQYKRDGYRYYGFPLTDSLLYRMSEPTSATLNMKQAVNQASANFNLSNYNSRSKVDYSVSLGYNYLWNLTGQTAHNGGYKGFYTIKNPKYDIVIDTRANYFYQDSIINYYSGQTNHQFIYASVHPQVVLKKKSWSLDAGFNLGTIIDDDTTATFHISPKIYFSYSPIQGWLELFAGTDGKLSANNYASIIEKNRYVNFNTEVKPSQEIISFYGGFKGKFSQRLAYNFDVNYSINQGQPLFYLKQFFYPDGNTEILNAFDVKYADFNALRFGGKIRYSSENVSVALEGNYYIYDDTAQVVLNHLPGFDASLETTVRIASRWEATIDANVIGQREAQMDLFSYKLNKTSGHWETTYLSSVLHTFETIININLGIEYAINQKLGIFLSANNILNQNYEIWHGYNAQGIMIMAGAHYAF